MTTLTLNTKERAFFYACAYLSALFASIIILWWTVLVGGNPLTFKQTDLIDRDGRVTSVVHSGDEIGIRRYICSTADIGVEFFPYLRDAAGVLYPLPSGLIHARKGCHPVTYGFPIPELAPGNYEYGSTIKFQANLVGRDEMATPPSLSVRIVK